MAIGSPLFRTLLYIINRYYLYSRLLILSLPQHHSSHPPHCAPHFVTPVSCYKARLRVVRNAHIDPTWRVSWRKSHDRQILCPCHSRWYVNGCRRRISDRPYHPLANYQNCTDTGCPSEGKNKIKDVFVVTWGLLLIQLLEQSCTSLILQCSCISRVPSRLMTVPNLLQVVLTKLMQVVRNKLQRACCHQLVTCRRYQTRWNNLLRVCWPHQPCYKTITTCPKQQLGTSSANTSCWHAATFLSNGFHCCH